MEDEHFYCESCNGELAAESDKLAAGGSEDGDDNVRHRCCEKLKEMLWKMKVCKFFMSKLHYLVRACYLFFVVDIIFFYPHICLVNSTGNYIEELEEHF